MIRILKEIILFITLKLRNENKECVLKCEIKMICQREEN